MLKIKQKEPFSSSFWRPRRAAGRIAQFLLSTPCGFCAKFQGRFRGLSRLPAGCRVLRTKPGFHSIKFTPSDDRGETN